jgi:hypothetical protein
MRPRGYRVGRVTVLAATPWAVQPFRTKLPCAAPACDSRPIEPGVLRACSTMRCASISVRRMKSMPHAQSPSPPFLAWSAVALAGVAAPVLAMLLLVDGPAAPPLALVGGPILAVALMGTGMIAAAVAGRLWVGVLLALLTAGGLFVLARGLGLASLPHPLSTGLAVVIASFSFAARGTLFARSASDKGWWIAVFVVGGEAAMLVTASVLPGALPDWLLVLLPAQWASVAVQTALTGSGTLAASSALIALAGTGGVTLLVAFLWPRRWPYLLMFSAWLGLSALVWYRPAPPMPRADLAVAAAGGLEQAGVEPATGGCTRVTRMHSGRVRQSVPHWLRADCSPVIPMQSPGVPS